MGNKKKKEKMDIFDFLSSSWINSQVYTFFAHAPRLTENVIKYIFFFGKSRLKMKNAMKLHITLKIIYCTTRTHERRTKKK